MENFSSEIVETITEYYANDGKDGKELTKDILLYLYHTTTDDRLKLRILEWFNKENYCIECGMKLQAYDWCEIHDELEGNPREWFTTWLCPICDRGEIEDGYTIKE
jgi:hypothetical protein